MNFPSDRAVGRIEQGSKPQSVKVRTLAFLVRSVLAAFVLGLACPVPAVADPTSSARSGARLTSSNPLGLEKGRSGDQHELHGIGFHAEAASTDVREVVDWVTTSGDNRALPFVVVDKVNAKVFLFDRQGELRGAAPALLGMARGDESVPGIGQRRLATILPGERTTPAGRFVAALGHDFEQDILWIDYDAALSLHRVIVGKPKDRRAQRLASASALDNRISFGCINVPAAFYDDIVVPAFKGTVGIVYILPDTKPIRAVFPMQPALKSVGSKAHSDVSIAG